MRAIRTATLLAVVFVLGAAPAAALADGPGVKLYRKGTAQPIVLPGGLFAGGVSMYTLISKAKVNLNALVSVTVVRARGDLLVLRPGQLGGGIIVDDGTVTRFKRSASATGNNVVEATAASGPLEIAVDGGADIAVKATANPSRAAAGKTVRFTARVRGGPVGASYSYDWDFGDGETDSYSGAQTSHVYEYGGELRAQVSVRNLDTDCSAGCAGVGIVDLTIGDPPDTPDAPEPTPGSGTGSPNVAGSADGTGGGGQGGSGGTSGSGTGSADPTATPASEQAEKTPPPAPKAFGVTISGVLINDVGTTVQKLPKGKPAGAAKGARAIRGGGDSAPSVAWALGGLLALVVVSLGARNERRGVRLRLA